MGMWDWLTGTQNMGNAFAQQGMGYAGAAGQANPATPGLLHDQNFLRGLGEAGAAVSAGGSAGEVLGNFATNYGRRRATQRVGEQQLEKQQNTQSELMEFIKSLQGEYGNKLVGDAKDMNTPNKITMDAKGVNVLFPNKSPEPGFAGEQSPIEMDKGVGSGGSDLPDFLKTGLGWGR